MGRSWRRPRTIIGGCGACRTAQDETARLHELLGPGKFDAARTEAAFKHVAHRIRASRILFVPAVLSGIALKASRLRLVEYLTHQVRQLRDEGFDADIAQIDTGATVAHNGGPLGRDHRRASSPDLGRHAFQRRARFPAYAGGASRGAAFHRRVDFVSSAVHGLADRRRRLGQHARAQDQRRGVEGLGRRPGGDRRSSHRPAGAIHGRTRGARLRSSPTSGDHVRCHGFRLVALEAVARAGLADGAVDGRAWS